MFSGKHSAGSKYIFTAGSPYGGHKTLIIKSVLEIIYDYIRRCLVWKIRMV